MKRNYSPPCVKGLFSIDPASVIALSIEIGGTGGDIDPGDLEEGDLANWKSTLPDEPSSWD